MENHTAITENSREILLVAAVQQGGRGAHEAFAQLIEMYQPMLLPFAVSKLSSATDAEDLLQECWIRIWNKISTHFQGGNFKAWIFEIVRNAIFDEGRSKKRTFGLIEEGIEVSDRRSEGLEHERDRLEALQGCLEGLEQGRATIVRLRLLGTDFKVISEQLKIPANTAMTMFHRAKETLRKCVEGKLA